MESLPLQSLPCQPDADERHAAGSSYWSRVCEKSEQCNSAMAPSVQYAAADAKR